VRLFRCGHKQTMFPKGSVNMSPHGSTAKDLLAGMCGLGSLAAAGTVGWIITPELYQTHIRTTAHGLAYSFSRVGAFSSSYVVRARFPADARLRATTNNALRQFLP
jgi:hypothetical protein